MAGEIKHSWNGTILTITSDSGTSSMDLQGRKGDDGIRGPQGPAGIIVNADGTPAFEGLATEAYVEERLKAFEENEIKVDLTGYATEQFVRLRIAEAQLSGDGTPVDLTLFVTKNELDTKGYQTASQVETAINNALATLDGDGEDY